MRKQANISYCMASAVAGAECAATRSQGNEPPMSRASHSVQPESLSQVCWLIQSCQPASNAVQHYSPRSTASTHDIASLRHVIHVIHVIHGTHERLFITFTIVSITLWQSLEQPLGLRRCVPCVSTVRQAGGRSQFTAPVPTTTLQLRLLIGHACGTMTLQERCQAG